LNIAPKRANWDLKREMEKKTAKLERKTQEAIHTLIRSLPASVPLHAFVRTNTARSYAGQRLTAQKGESDDIVGALRAEGKGAAGDDASDEDED
jgi:coiled-coil domain-containing protein 12